VRRRPRLPPQPPDRADRLTDFVEGSPGVFPVSIVPWPLLMARRRVARRAQAHDRFTTVATAVLLGALFMVNLSVTLISVAIPRIAGEFDAPVGTLVWAVTGPILAAAVLGPSFGKAGDLFGHRLVFLLGMGASAAFTACIALSTGPIGFVGTRILAAAGGAAAGPAALAFINRLHAPADRAGALGWWSFVMAGSPVVGVVAGGPIVDTIGWRWVFVVQAPLVLAATVVAALILPETTRAARVRFDAPGALTLALAVGAVMLGITMGPQRGWTDPVVLALCALGVVSSGAFGAVEARSPAPLLPPAYWRTRNFVAPTLTLALVNVAYMGSFVLAPIMLQSAAFGYTAAHTSRVIIARPLAFAVVGPLAGWLAGRLGERVLATAGAASIVVSMLAFTAIRPGTSAWVVALALALAGLGMGVAAPALTATVANAVDPGDLGVAGAAQQMLQQVGLVIGIQGLQAVQASLEPAGLVASYHGAFAVAAAVAAAGVVAALAVRPSPPPAPDLAVAGTGSRGRLSPQR
jgi:MFS family permease